MVHQVELAVPEKSIFLGHALVEALELKMRKAFQRHLLIV